MTKVKMSKEDSSSADFVERRRCALERYSFCAMMRRYRANAYYLLQLLIHYYFVNYKSLRILKTKEKLMV